ncbi:monocarboxylate transporter 12-like isoform X1 [Crassostrea virginica]
MNSTSQEKMTCKACSANRAVLRNSKNSESTNVHNRNDVTPIGRDGGYAWVILAGSFYSSFCMEGLIGSFGLLLPTLMEEFRASAAVVSMLNSSLIGIFLVLGFFSSVLIERYGTRPVMFTGSCVYSLGLFFSFLAPNILVLFVTYGLLCGFGIGLIFVPATMIVNQYFDRRRPLANGILCSGSGIGILVMSPIIENSIEAFGWRGALLIYACFTLQLCVCACLMRPIKLAKNPAQKQPDDIRGEQTYPLMEKELESEKCEPKYASLPFLRSTVDTCSCSTLSLPMLFGSHLSIDKGKQGSQIDKKENQKQERKSCALPPFLTRKPFLFIAVGCLLTQMGQFIPLTFIGDYGNHVGVTSQEISIVLSIFGVANTIGRFFAGLIANTRCLTHLAICSFGLVLSAVACFLFFLCTTFGTLIGFSITYGFFIGFFPPMQPLMIMDYLGLEQLTAGFGFVTMLKGPAAIIGPPFAGALLGMTGNYETVNGLAGVIFTLAVCAQMFALCWEPHVKKSPTDAELDV